MNGTAARPLVSTAEKPVYYYIESASAQSGYTGNVLLTRASTDVKLRHAPKTTLNNDSAMWQIVYESGTTKLKNKLTNNYMSGSHTNAVTGDAFTTTLYSGQTYYKMQSGGQSPTLAFNSNLCDRQTTEVDRLHWYFIVAPGSEDNYYYLTFGTPVIPEVSTPESPVYYYIESASSGTGVNPVYLRGNYIISPKTSGSRLKWGIKSQAGDSALWAIVNESGTIKLKNKATGLYMSGSHTGLTTGDAFTYTAYDSPDQLQYKINSGGQSPTVAWNSNLCDRYSDQGANSRTAWYFIGPVGPTGNALNLNGTSQYMRIPHNAAFNFSNTEEFSISFWVNSNLVAGRNARMISKRGPNAVSTDKSGYEIWGLNSTTNFMAVNTTTGTLNTNLYSVWGTVTGAASTWTHIAYVVTGTGTDRNVIMYQNGQVAGSAKISLKDVSSFSVTNLYDVMIGKGQYEGGGAVNGKMDNIRFWSRGLTQSEVEADQSSVVNTSTANLIAAYDFSTVDLNAMTVADIKGNHTAYLHNYDPLSVSNLQQFGMTGRGNTNDPILRATTLVSATDAIGQPISSVTLSSAVLNLTGTTNLSDITSLKIYSTGSTVNFDPRDPITKGAVLLESCTPASGDITCTLSGTLAAGTNYLWVTADIAENATEGNQIDIALISITAGSTYTLASNNPTGTTNIMLTRKLIVAPGDAGSANYRIPSVISANDGSILVFTDKRKYNNSDLPQDIDVVVHRSTDKGKTWSAATTIAQGTAVGAGFGDVSSVVTRTGKILTIFAGGPGFGASTASNPIKIYKSESTDNGISWTTPTDITLQFYGSGCSDPTRAAWSGMFINSGRMLYTTAGRIMAVGLVRDGSGTNKNYVVYSDDEGATWSVASTYAVAGGDEANIMELADGTYMVTSRKGGTAGRLKATSADGLTWSGTSSNISELVEPGCNGDFIRFSKTSEGAAANILLHSIPNHSSSRRNVSVFVSTNEGTTWPTKKSIVPEMANNGLSAYSSLTVLPDGTIGAYVEVENYSSVYEMYFMNFSLDWLTGGKQTFTENRWLGTSSSDFNTTANWARGVVPETSSDITVASNAVNPLVLSGTAYGKLTVNPGGKVTIPTEGNIELANLVLRNDIFNPSTLLNNGTLTVTETTTVNQAITNLPRTYYMGSPIDGTATVSGFTRYATFDETTDKWSATLSEITGNQFTATAGQGYLIQVPEATNISFAGTLNTGDKTTGLTIGGKKYNFLGNPYPSYLNAKTMVDANATVEKSVWFRGKDTDNTYKFFTYNVPGDLWIPATASVDASATNNGFIPPMQGFWVKANETGTGFSFTDAMRTHNTTETAIPLKAPQAAANQILRVQVSNGTALDETVVLFNENATTGYDSYDASKMMNTGTGALNIYTKPATENLVLNSMPAITYDVEIPVGMKLAAGTYTVSASQFSNFAEGTVVQLIDKLTGAITILSEGAYEFSLTNDIDNADRFALVFPSYNVPTGMDNGNSASVYVFANDNRIVVNAGENASGTMIRVYNSVGQCLTTQSVNGSVNEINGQFSPGVYLVRVNNVTVKVVMK